MPNKISIRLGGLHCRACEIINEERLSSLSGVTSVKVNQQTGQADLCYQKTAPTNSEIKKVLAPGYTLIEEDGSPACEVPSQKQSTNWQLIIPLIILGYWLFSRLNLIDTSSLLAGEFSLSLALIIGLVAGFSTCLALVGGLVFGLATNYAHQNPNASRLQKFRPHLYFNLGRLGGFFLLGGLLGLVGSALKLSPFFSGLLTILVGLVILMLGLKLLGVRALNRFELSLPKNLARYVKADNPWILGALTFFLPCGFTQAVQIYALSSGSFLSGGLIMALFALGTAPGLLSIGGLVALVNKKWTGQFLKASGVILILFALFNLQTGWNLFSVGLNSKQQKNIEQPTQQSTDGDFQVVYMTESNRGYSPNRLEIKGDQPVRWIINAEAPYSCGSQLIVPSLGIERQLEPGENIIEFVPPSSGTIPFSCSMGMYRGTFQIISE